MSIDVLTAENLRNRSEQIDPAELVEGNSVPHLMIPTLIDLWRAGLLPGETA